jgi:hypothetical protein
VVLLIVAVQLSTDAAGDTQKYIGDHWRAIQARCCSLTPA